jgi:hypothetical protein
MNPKQIARAFDEVFPGVREGTAAPSVAAEVEPDALPRGWDLQQSLNGLAMSADFTCYRLAVGEATVIAVRWTVEDFAGVTLFDDTGTLIATSDGGKRWKPTDGTPVPAFQEPAD